ncbi:hypothetical protein RHSP_44317 [Rhizobium freirei PRF 81]|uniref:Uncharacterized protein n=1 Tax=Rhizobium freirei PRF 81 TaxID=363754 RepID=N6V372_9HYPH|nr:hypothetical protein RHSP_44317 [Rhizobium freirei PRF 81]
MNAAPTHVDRLDAAGGGGADRLIIALADHEVVLHDPAEWRQRQDMRGDHAAVFDANVENELLVDQRQVEQIGAAFMPNGLKAVFLDQIEDGDGALMLDIGRRTADRVVQDHIAQPKDALGHALPFEIEADRDRPRMCVQPLGIGERDRRRPECTKLLRPEPQDRGALDEVKHRKAGGEACGAGRRQHMVRAADIIADHFRRVSADEDGAGVADTGEQRLGIVDRKLQMLGRDAVGKRNGLLQLGNQDDRAEIAPACGRRLRAAELLQLPLDRGFHGLAEFGIVGDQDRLRAFVMLGLSKEIGGNPIRIVVLVGDDEHFRRAGDHVDADGAEHLAFGRGHIGIAGTGDLGDRLDRFGAIGKRRNRLRAADAVDFFDAGHAGGRKDGWIDRAVLGRHDDDDAIDPGDLGRHGIHQHRARIARRAAGYIETNGLDRRPARAEADAEIVLIDIVLGQLPAVMRFDAGGSDLQRAQNFRRHGLDGGIDLGFADAHRRHGEIDAVELFGIIRKSSIAACPHIVDDASHHGIHILGYFPLGRQESGELLFEPFRRLIQPDSQC